QATTHPVAPLLMVHGPIARELGVHAGPGCFGPVFRPNATIGRAIRLILMNVGGAWPGRHDMATQGSPAKFAYCIAEREDASPWGPLHAGANVVTVFGGEAPHNVNDHVSTTVARIPAAVVDTDRKSTRLNSSHQITSYAVFCLKIKKPTHSTCELELY